MPTNLPVGPCRAIPALTSTAASVMASVVVETMATICGLDVFCGVIVLKDTLHREKGLVCDEE